MGNDGGSIPTRRELVKEAARDPNLSAIKEKQREHLAHRWTQCPISHKALRKPIVADYAGNLYNKDAILQYLLPLDVSPLNKSVAEQFLQGRVRSLKDIVEVHFEEERDADTKSERRICPVTSKELGPNIKAVFLVPCGHAFSKEAIEVMKDITNCPSCGTGFDLRDVVPILPTSEAAKKFTSDRLERLIAVGLTHSLKKAQSSKKRRAVEEPKNGRVIVPRDCSTTLTVTADASASTTKDGTGRIDLGPAVKKKARLDADDNKNLKSLFHKGNSRLNDGNFMTRGFSITPAASRS